MIARSSVVLFALAALALSQADNTSLTFDQIPISKDLHYVPCFQNFTCARMEVPLDYKDPKVGNTHVALLKWPAPKQPALGDLIFNPGGPGYSAVDELLGLTGPLSRLLGERYNIVALEPRGIQYSGPSVHCFGESDELGLTYLTSRGPAGWTDHPQRAKTFETTGAFGSWCSNVLSETANYVNTPAVAADMLHYSELLAKSQGKPCNDTKVNLYGNSYGTTLGMTFAQLYPDRVGHFILDAVVDIEDHYFGNWSQNLLQGDEAVNDLFTSCAAAGPRCALYQNGSTAESIKKRVDDLLLRLVDAPISATNPKEVLLPITVDDKPLRSAMRNAVYNPSAYFAPLAQQIAELERGNASSFGTPINIGEGGDSESSFATDIYGGIFTRCLDNQKRFPGTLEAMEDLFVYNKQLSTYFGESWANENLLECRNIRFTPPVSQRIDKISKVKTNTPILFTDNTIDGLSSSYHKMSPLFEGSVVMLQKANGHGLLVARSNCTETNLQQYLETGKLPPHNTICDTDYQPFPEV